jgi:hypothetical protein
VKLIWFIVIVLILFQQSAGFIIILNYYQNKAEITKLYCVNKEKPILKCNGKCHLKKSLEFLSQTNPDEKEESVIIIQPLALLFYTSEVSISKNTELNNIIPIVNDNSCYKVLIPNSNPPPEIL